MSDPKPVVIVYTLEHCPRCKILKRMLEKLEVPYSEVDAMAHASHLTRMGFMEVPVIEIDGELYSFESGTQLVGLLKEKGLVF